MTDKPTPTLYDLNRLIHYALQAAWEADKDAHPFDIDVVMIAAEQMCNYRKMAPVLFRLLEELPRDDVFRYFLEKVSLEEVLDMAASDRGWGGRPYKHMSDEDLIKNAADIIYRKKAEAA